MKENKIQIHSEIHSGLKNDLKFRIKSFKARLGYSKIYRVLKHRAVALAAVLLLLSTYLFGLSSGLATSRSYAEFVFTDSTSLVKDSSAMLKVKPVVGTGQLPLKIDEDNMFGMPLDQLEKVFAKKQAEMTEAMFDQRAEKIKAYLQEYNSPFADYASVISRQSHWQLIMAISFAESTWGKNCVDNNCSNIGVKPGHELWHQYKNYGEWIVDFNKLLERRYKDWSLDDMCGVYVKPCNKNWLMATSQVLQELRERNIN